ncbi:MAG: hypothetical protein JKY60_20365 [Kordiimonadaceae bacterium]|nr:hypothetical protein [Kordiimonadaceae bacterium]
MIAIFDTETGALEQIVSSFDGVDLTGKDTVTAPDARRDLSEWDAVSRTFVPGVFTAERTAAKGQIDTAAEALYQSLIQGGLIGSVLHPLKHKEAVSYLAAANPVPSDYPSLLGEVGITGATLQDVATAIEAKPAAAASKIFSASLVVEPLRLAAKAQIDAATTRTEILTTTATTVASLDRILF